MIYLRRCSGLVLLVAATALADAVPQRIVSTVPAMTEMLFAVGAGKQVVGVTAFCSYPPEATQCEKVGGYADLSFEKLLSLRPDLVVTADYSKHLRQQCANAKLPTLNLKTDTVAEIIAAIEQLGSVTGHDAEGRALTANINNALNKLRTQARSRTPRRTLLIIGRPLGSFQGLLSVGAGGFLNDLITIAGGTNVLADVKQGWPQINIEAVLTRQPDVIIELTGERFPRHVTPDEVQQRKAEWRRFPSIPAVAKGQVGVLVSDHALIPGPRIADTVQGMAELLK